MIRVSVFNAHPRRRIRRRELERVMRGVLRGEGVRHAAVSLVCVDSRRCRAINREFLSHDEVTDVISFPLESGERLEGEIYVNLDRVHNQAREYGVTSRNELARLTIHGILHLAGYEDLTRPARTRMHARQERYVSRLAGERRKI